MTIDRETKRANEYADEVSSLTAQLEGMEAERDHWRQARLTGVEATRIVRELLDTARSERDAAVVERDQARELLKRAQDALDTAERLNTTAEGLLNLTHHEPTEWARMQADLDAAEHSNRILSEANRILGGERDRANELLQSARAVADERWKDLELSRRAADTMRDTISAMRLIARGATPGTRRGRQADDDAVSRAVEDALLPSLGGDLGQLAMIDSALTPLQLFLATDGVSMLIHRSSRDVPPNIPLHLKAHGAITTEDSRILAGPDVVIGEISHVAGVSRRVADLLATSWIPRAARKQPLLFVGIECEPVGRVDVRLNLSYRNVDEDLLVRWAPRERDRRLP